MRYHSLLGCHCGEVIHHYTQDFRRNDHKNGQPWLQQNMQLLRDKALQDMLTRGSKVQCCFGGTIRVSLDGKKP
jgi:hypothetical protein